MCITYHFSQLLCTMHLLILCSLFLQLPKVYLTNFYLTKKLVCTKLLFTSCSNYSQDVFFTTKYRNNQIYFASQANVQKLYFIHSIIIVYSSWKRFVRKVLTYTQPCFYICGRMERFFLRNQIDGLTETTLSQKQTRYY